jgi:hypothetical protein
VDSGNPEFPWEFRVNFQITDTGGVGFSVTGMQTTVTSALSGAALVTSAENPFLGVHIPARGQETRQFHLGAYRMENGTKAGRMTVKIDFRDDNGTTSTSTVGVDIRYVGVARS